MVCTKTFRTYEIFKKNSCVDNLWITCGKVTFFDLFYKNLIVQRWCSLAKGVTLKCVVLEKAVKAVFCCKSIRAILHDNLYNIISTLSFKYILYIDLKTLK